MQKLKTMNAELVAGTFSTQSLGIRIARVAMAGIGAVIACGTIPGYVEPVTQTLADGTSVTTAGHWMEPPQIAFRWLGVAMAVLGAIVQRKNGATPQ